MGRKPIHGGYIGNRASPEVMSWRSMVNRCSNPKHKQFKNYGGRGISVCDKWRNSFADFLSDMGKKPTPKHTIERIDTNGNYEPSNCQWATMTEQHNNRRNNRCFSFNGKTKTLTEWAREYDLHWATLKARLDAGWSIKKALMTTTRKPVLLTLGTETKELAEWASILGLKRHTLWMRIFEYGWTAEKALTTPVRR